MKPGPSTPAPTVTVTFTRDPARRQQLARLIERTLAGEFQVEKPLPTAAD